MRLGTHLIPLLQQDLVVLAECRAENDRRDCLEAVDPLFALGPLPSHVKQVNRELAHAEARVGDAVCL